MAKRQTIAQMQAQYIQAAQYYWLKAAGPQEQLESATMRMIAASLAERLGPNLTPSPAVCRAAAAATWPAEKVHA